MIKKDKNSLSLKSNKNFSNDLPLEVSSALPFNQEMFAKKLQKANFKISSINFKNQVNSLNNKYITSEKLLSKEEKEHLKEPIIPGDLVGVNIIRGDIVMGATGTVTYVNGNKLLAFGHSMTGQGESNLTLYRAFTDASMPSLFNSFKIGKMIGKPIGRITLDLRDGILGEISQESGSYIPIKINLKSNFKKDEEFNFEIINDKHYFFLLWSLLDSSFNHYYTMAEDYNLSYSVKVKTDHKNKDISFSSTSTSYSDAVHYDSISYSSGLGIKLQNILYRLLENKFNKVNIKSIDISFNFYSKKSLNIIKSAYIYKKEYFPNEKVNVFLNFAQYYSSKKERQLSFKIPNNLLPGNYLLNISPEQTFLQNKKNINRTYEFENIDKMIEYFNESGDNKKVSIWLKTHQPSLSIGSKIYKTLPSKQLTLIKESQILKKQIVNFIYENKEFDSPVYGNVISLPITIKNRTSHFKGN